MDKEKLPRRIYEGTIGQYKPIRALPANTLHNADGTPYSAGSDTLDAESLARLFHETYERLAPQFSYETRKDSAVPWERVPEKNKRLMIAVAGEVLNHLEVR